MEIKSMTEEAVPHYPDSINKNSFVDGLEFQDFVMDLFADRLNIPIQNYSSKKNQFKCGENLQGVEIKLDNRCDDTGRISIEIGEKSNASVPHFTKSGILRDDNSWLYVIGNPRVVFVFAKKHLVMHYKNKNPEVINYLPPTIEKFYIDFKAAVPMSVLFFVLDESLYEKYGGVFK